MKNFGPIKSVKEIRDLMRIYREMCEMTLETISALSHLSTRFLSDFECGKEPADLEKVLKLFRTLGLDVFLRAAKSKPSLTIVEMEARMLVAAKQAVFTSTSWLTADDLRKIQKHASKSSQDDPENWVEQGRIFSIENAGKHFFPFYAIDPDEHFLPRQCLAEILHLFEGHKNSWGAAFWFSSSCGFLGGQRPQDLLVSQPQFVFAAAKDEVQGLTHG